MNADKIEDLFIRSLDQPLSDLEKEQLVKAMHDNAGLAKELSPYKNIRENLLRKKAATFGPYFSQKVITRIQNLRVQIDQQIVFFFKKYQLAALGVLIALLAVNVVFSDQLNIASVLGIQEDSAAAADDDIATFDFLDSLTNN